MLVSVFSNWITMVVVAACSLVLTPVFIREMGPTHYGLWVLVASILDYTGLLDFGLQTTVQRSVARLRGTADREATDRLFGTALLISSSIGCVIVGLVLLLARLLPDFLGLEGGDRQLIHRVVSLLGISIGITFVVRTLGAYLMGLQRFDLFNAGAMLVSLSRALILFVVLRAGFGIVGCAIANVAVASSSATLHLILVRRADRGLSIAWSNVSARQASELLRFSVYVFLTQLGGYLRFYSDSIVIGRTLGVHLVPRFSVVGSLMEFFRAILFAVTSPMLSLVTELSHGGRTVEADHLFLRTTKLTTILTLLIASLLVVEGRTLLVLWLGESFGSSYPLLCVLTVGSVVALVQSPSMMLLTARGAHAALGWWTLAEGVANVVLSILWAPRFGLMGVALGTTVPLLITKLGIQPWYTLRISGLPLRRYGGVFVRPGIATGLFLLGCYVMLPAHLAATLPSFVTRVAIESALHLALMCAIGLDAEDRHWLGLQWKRWVVARAGAV